MNCPKCNAEMEAVQFADIEVDRCTACQGIWFDMLEREHLKGMTGAEVIDIGDTRRGKEMDKVERIDCPACHTPMIRMVDLDQPHIHFEACKVCFGVFFDAGEFRDYKKKSIIDYLRDLLTRERK